MSFLLKVSLFTFLDLILMIICTREECINNIGLDANLIQSRELFAQLKRKKIMDHIIYMIDSNSIIYAENSFLEVNKNFQSVKNNKNNVAKENNQLYVINSTMISNSDEKLGLKNSTNSENQLFNNQTIHKNITIDSSVSSNINNESRLKCLNNTNFTICINITTNNNENCIPECYLNCQVHFQDKIEQKFCLLNVCKCEIIEEIIQTDDTIKNKTNKNETIIITINNNSSTSSSKTSNTDVLVNQTKNDNEIKFLNDFEDAFDKFSKKEVIREQEEEYLENSSKYLKLLEISSSDNKVIQNETNHVSPLTSNNIIKPEDAEKNNYAIYCSILIFSLISIFFIILYITFVMTWNQIKQSNSLNIDQRLRIIQINNSNKIFSSLNNEKNKISENKERIDPLFLQDNDLQEKLLAENN